ncbi:hypothetical protein V6N13_044822 [Hibiscus sabdariffa]|uniref:Uncharacterized protein n=1 Tax=Hibiscus sabdariffa TaxID=183260 RepID=A0ABR2RJB2_9ROSI
MYLCHGSRNKLMNSQAILLSCPKAKFWPLHGCLLSRLEGSGLKWILSVCWYSLVMEWSAMYIAEDVFVGIAVSALGIGGISVFGSFHHFSSFMAVSALGIGAWSFGEHNWFGGFVIEAI